MRTAVLDPKPLLAALAGERRDPPPIWFMRQAGRYLPEYRAVRRRVSSFLELCHSPELASEVTLQPIRRFNLDGAVIFADILLVPHALGQSLWFEPGSGPKLPPLSAPDALPPVRDAAFHDELAPVYETLRQTKPRLPGHTALIGFAGAPWTVASYMLEGQSSRDFTVTKAWAYTASARFQHLIDRLVDATVAYLDAQIAAGAEAVQLFDSWAGALPADQVARWSLEPLQRIVAAIKRQHPGVPVVVFPRGTGASYARFARESGADAVSLDTPADPHWAATAVQPHTAVQGNLDPHHALIGGEAMTGACRRIVDALASGPHVFNLGHGIVPQTPPDHIARVVAAVRTQRNG